LRTNLLELELNQAYQFNDAENASLPGNFSSHQQLMVTFESSSNLQVDDHSNEPSQNALNMFDISRDSSSYIIDEIINLPQEESSDQYLYANQFHKSSKELLP
jgi:hypothetical protein